MSTSLSHNIMIKLEDKWGRAFQHRNEFMYKKIKYFRKGRREPRNINIRKCQKLDNKKVTAQITIMSCFKL